MFLGLDPADVAALADALDVDRVLVADHSSGGPTPWFAPPGWASASWGEL
jgi:alkanesulfonate monooxygenase SsuD/methylene tetrahydromethanopterin reductase-like flavin-dependent oxidoreductase (luciferase family)